MGKPKKKTKTAAKPKAGAPTNTTKATKPKVAKAPKKPAKTAKASKPKPVLPSVVKKPKRPAKANKAPPVPHAKTIVVPVKKEPPKPKATITRAKAVSLANTFLAANVGRAALYAPRTSRFRVGSVVDQDGIINILFCHEGREDDPAITGLGPKCRDALLAAHPQLLAFDIQVQTIRM